MSPMFVDQKDLLDLGIYDCPKCRCEMIDVISKNNGPGRRQCQDCGLDLEALKAKKLQKNKKGGK